MKNIVIVMYMGPTGLGILRSLGSKGINAYGLDWNQDAVGFSSRFCKKRLIFPNPMKYPDTFVQQLVALGKQQERPMVLIPAADYYVSLISKYSSQLSDTFLFNIPKPAIVESIVDKKKQYELAMEHRIPAPLTYSPTNDDELLSQKGGFVFPVLVKGAVADEWQIVFERKAFVAKDFEELRECCDLPFARNIKVVIQEIIPGPNTNHYKVCAYYSKKHGLLGIFSTQKTRQFSIDFGIGSYMTSGYNEELINLGRQFFEGIGYTGVGSIEFKRDDRDGQFKIIELNPRFWQQNIQATVAGINFPSINYFDCVGIDLEPCLSFKDDIRWIDFWSDMRSYIAHRQQRKLSLHEWLTSVLKAKSFSYFSSNDIKPFLIRLKEMLEYYFRRLFRS